jgi:hypothetical protein
MADSVVKETIAYKIVRQIVDHVWGDEDLSDREFLSICAGFRLRGGSWEAVVRGDMRSVEALEDSIDSFMEARSIARVAARVAALPGYGSP